jgi:hypothetical protein
MIAMALASCGGLFFAAPSAVMVLNREFIKTIRPSGGLS